MLPWRREFLEILTQLHLRAGFASSFYVVVIEAFLPAGRRRREVVWF